MMQNKHMKRTNLVLDEQLLETVTRLFGAKTYSAAVNRALEEAIRNNKIQQLTHFVGKSVWQGDLSEMREDQHSPKNHRARKVIKN